MRFFSNLLGPLAENSTNEARDEGTLEVEAQENFSLVLRGRDDQIRPLSSALGASFGCQTLCVRQRDVPIKGAVSALSFFLSSYIVSYHTQTTSSKMGKEKAHVSTRQQHGLHVGYGCVHRHRLGHRSRHQLGRRHQAWLSVGRGGK